MNTTLHRSSTHPPDTEDREVLLIPASDELRRLALADRLSLRIGVWLLRRARHPRAARRPSATPADALHIERRMTSPRDAMALAAFDMQRQLR